MPVTPVPTVAPRAVPRPPVAKIAHWSHKSLAYRGSIRRRHALSSTFQASSLPPPPILTSAQAARAVTVPLSRLGRLSSDRNVSCQRLRKRSFPGAGIDRIRVLVRASQLRSFVSLLLWFMRNLFLLCYIYMLATERPQLNEPYYLTF